MDVIRRWFEISFHGTGMIPFLDPAGKASSPESGFGGEVGEMDEESLDGGNGIAPGIGTGAEVHIEAGFVRGWDPGCDC